MYNDKELKSGSYVSDLSRLPSEKHWVILTSGSATDSVYGMNNTISYLNYQVFLTKDEWLKEIDRLEKRNADSYYSKAYRAIEVNPAQIKRTITVDVE